MSHDRYFMDRLVDHLFVFEGDGVIGDFPGNYTQYRLQLKEATNVVESKKLGDMPAESLPKKSNRVSFKDKRAFELLEKEIAGLTKEREEITEKMGAGSLPFEELEILSKRIGEVNDLLDEKEMRWLELSEMMEP